MTLPVFIEGRIVAVVGVANKQVEYNEEDVLQLASMMDSVWQIAEHRRVDVEMRKLSQAVEQSPVSIVITDAKGNIEFVNPRFTQVTGYEAGEVLGKNPRVLKSGETPPERYKELWETITAGKVWEGEFHNKKKNGELFWEHAAISPIRDGNGSITHYLGIKEDITERKKLEDQLRQAQKMEAIGQLAGGVAHDFNNILSTITGYASLLEMSITSDATLRDYVAEIAVASERGANLTQSLLAFSRKQEASLAAVDLNDQIRSSHKVLSRLVGEDIDLVLDLDREDTVVEADAGQLQQVLMNLASNARDAMRNGGTLRIATKNVTIGGDHEERYALEHPGKYAILSMIDTGAGMEQAVRERIFEPFYTTKGVGKGTGLGLSIVYGIVKKHRGSITVDSEPGKGTVFSIYLPRTERSISGRGADEALPQAAAGNRTILLVEDEETVRRVLRLTLEAYGYRVIEAVDGEDAVRVFRENQDRGIAGPVRPGHAEKERQAGLRGNDEDPAGRQDGLHERLHQGHIRPKGNFGVRHYPAGEADQSEGPGKQDQRGAGGNASPYLTNVRVRGIKREINRAGGEAQSISRAGGAPWTTRSASSIATNSRTARPSISTFASMHRTSCSSRSGLRTFRSGPCCPSTNAPFVR